MRIVYYTSVESRDIEENEDVDAYWGSLAEARVAAHDWLNPSDTDREDRVAIHRIEVVPRVPVLDLLNRKGFVRTRTVIETWVIDKRGEIVRRKGELL